MAALSFQLSQRRTAVQTRMTLPPTATTPPNCLAPPNRQDQTLPVRPKPGQCRQASKLPVCYSHFSLLGPPRDNGEVAGLIESSPPATSGIIRLNPVAPTFRSPNLQGAQPMQRERSRGVRLLRRIPPGQDKKRRRFTDSAGPGSRRKKRRNAVPMQGSMLGSHGPTSRADGLR